MSIRSMRRYGAVFSAASVLLSHAALAETTTDAARAKVLFDEGRALAEAGKYDEACPRFEKSLEIDAGTGTRFHLADCWENEGRIADAALLFTRVADDAHAVGQIEREQVARERALALEPTSTAPPAEAGPLVLPPVVVPGADEAELQQQIQVEYGVLADVEVGIRELKRSLALLAPPSSDPQVRKLHIEMASLDAALADAWHVANRVTFELAGRKSAKSPRDLNHGEGHASR